jgi:hypothetical protein
MNAAVDLNPDIVHAARDSARYSHCISASRRVRWDIDADVLRGRYFDLRRTLLPASMSRADQLGFLGADERRALSHIQGRTYTSLLGLAGRFTAAQALEISQEHWLGDQLALEALVRFCDEKLKHQELFRQLERLIDDQMPPGYRCVADPNEFARKVLSRSAWAVLAFACHFDTLAQVHYTQSIGVGTDVCGLFRDAFRFLWLEECQHAIVDEIEWRREDRRLTARQREHAVTDLAGLFAELDCVLQQQAAADTAYFLAIPGREFSHEQARAIRAVFMRAYRWQHIVAGLRHPHFVQLLTGMTTAPQVRRIRSALAPDLRFQATAA